MSTERADALRRWHEDAAAELHRIGTREVEYLGFRLTVPEQVFPPAPMSTLLGEALLAEVRPEDRVLDMGTGCGVNAVLAAQTAHRVVAVDVNPVAVEAARANAARHGLSHRITCVEGDLFDGLDGVFDLIVFDPPFRWFAPRDLLEVAFADEGYRTLRRFFATVHSVLADDGRVLMFFGTSGDLVYFEELIDGADLDAEVLSSRGLDKDGMSVTYCAFRLVSEPSLRGYGPFPPRSSGTSTP